MDTTHLNPSPSGHRGITHGTSSATLADVLERILDKGLVIAGDVKIKIVDIELLTIQIRLLICSVDKAREMGIDWWTSSSYLNAKLTPPTPQVSDLSERISRLESLQQVGIPQQNPVLSECVPLQAAIRDL
jgi:hypothetical protein